MAELPPIQTSPGATVNTANRSAVVPVATGCRPVPSKCSAVPPCPTIQTSFGAVPQTSVRSTVTPLAMVDTAWPS